MDDRSDAFLALPGGLGTLEELFEVWVARSLGMHASRSSRSTSTAVRARCGRSSSCSPSAASSGRPALSALLVGDDGAPRRSTSSRPASPHPP
jgi:hypothetical protein